MNSALLQVEDLRFLDNGPYSFSVQEHEVIGLSGKSGIGKTQLLRAIVETINYHGSLLFKGSSPEKYSPSQWRRLVALIPAEPQWWRESVGEHFAEDVPRQLLQRMVVDLGFEVDILSWKIERLSTGERQRLAMARALILNPAILLLDEPCSALDAQATQKVERLLLTYKDKPDSALVWVSHDDEQLQRVASCCYQVHHNSLEVRWQHQ
jgi:ABC-type iron transport system FetAB ATPase subunit